MLRPFAARFNDMDDEELLDLRDETENPKLMERIDQELARRKKTRATRGSPFKLFLGVLILFAVLAFAIAVAVIRG